MGKTAEAEISWIQILKDSKAKEWKCRPHQESVKKLKGRLKELTCRKTLGTATGRIAKINQVARGLINYYALGSTKTAMTEIDVHFSIGI